MPPTFSSAYNADLSLTHPPYALFCAAQTSLLLPPAHRLRRTTPYIRCPSASLDYVVEGWFLGPGATGPGGPEFASWSEESASKYGTSFVSSVSDLPAPSRPCVALISGRTADNPRLLTRMHKRGMQGDIFGKTRRAHGVGIAEDEGRGGERGHRRAHGINENVCKYVRKTREFAETAPGSHVTFVSNNAYE